MYYKDSVVSLPDLSILGSTKSKSQFNLGITLSLTSVTITLTLDKLKVYNNTVPNIRCIG